MQIQEIVDLFLPKGADNLANTIGPQGNLIDKLEIFNAKYMLPEQINPLKVTKKWRWAPGTYDRVKEAYTRKILQWHRRPRTMNSLFDRKRVWYENDIKRELNDIEQYLIYARRDNAIWLDEKSDNGMLEQVTYEFTDKIKQLYKIAATQYDSFEAKPATKRDISYYNEYRTYNDGNEGLDVVDGQYILTINMPEKPIELTKDNVVIGSIPFPALTIMIKIDIPRWISHSISPQNIGEYTRNGDYQRYFNLAVYYEVPSKWYTGKEDDNKMFGGQHWPIYHPFVQSSGYHEDRFRPWNWRNVCWGSYGSEIINSFMSMDWNAFFLFIEKWLYQYEMIGANPLNNIRTSFLGIGTDTSTEMLDMVGYRGIDCANRLSQIFDTSEDYRDPQYDIGEILNYCDNVRDCSIRHEDLGNAQCVGYKRNLITYDHAELVNEIIEDEVEEPLLRKEAIHIHKWIREHFEFNGNQPFYGTERAYKRLFQGEDQKDLCIKYVNVFEGAYFQMSSKDQTVVAYVIMNKYWEAYVEIIAFSYLLKQDYQLEDEKWDLRFGVQKKRITNVLRDLLTQMTDDKVNKTDAEIEADNTRAEMMQWASKVSNGRITSNPFGERLEASMAAEDTENSEPSI